MSLKEEIKRQTSSGKVFMYENRLITKGGEVRWVWTSAELRRDARQRHTFTVFSMTLPPRKKTRRSWS
ncbi:PAS domain-containing protein [Hungatella effluvii]|uniref:PAS domain-containing protein n=1 Tax=Hungatella effluvii TaxID=1096246 RepID=UPI000D75507C